MSTTAPTRRERLRAETTREITAIALKQLAEGGPGAISLRGIAREMGMTARAIYSYFATRDDLITELISETSTSLADTLESARDAVLADDPCARLLAWGVALREWALANPEGFRLVYGDSIPGYQPPADGPAQQASLRVCGGLNRLVAAVSQLTQPDAVNSFVWSDFPSEYLDKVEAEAGTLSPAVVGLALRIWGRMHGLVTLEVYGHLGAVSNDPGGLYRAEMLDIIESAGGYSPRTQSSCG